MVKILVAEDEPNLRIMIGKSLTKEGYKVVECYDGKNALDTFYSEHFDLIVTDIMMPRMDGNQFAAKIRAGNPNIPILMLTALESIDDKEKGFNSGTDDYLVKPILMKELVLRVKALLRRYKINSEKRIELDNTIVDFSSGELTIKGEKITLSKKEFQLLSKLLSNPNIIFSREQLLDEIWGYDSESVDRTVDTHISSLKKKAVSEDFEILTVWGIGYKAVIKCYQQ